MWDCKQSRCSFSFGWQKPAATEFWGQEQYDTAPLGNTFYQLVHFPWASLIDSCGKKALDKQKVFFEALERCPPRTTLIRATICQHIYALDMLEWYQRLGITDLYWSHAVLDQTKIEGIRLHPFPLYPVRALGPESSTLTRDVRLLERSYLYSFIGAYTPHLYVTPVRQWIFDLPPRPDALVVRRNEWHYEKDVYQEQVQGLEVSAEHRELQQQRGDEFSEAMAQSVFSLCPSGSGPNSIRLWESLGFGCIPVLLADTLRLPGDQALWDRAIVRVEETQQAVASLPARLEALRSQPFKLLEMQDACRELWELYGVNGPTTVLSELADKNVVRERVLG